MRVENRKVGEGREVRDKKVDIAEGKKPNPRVFPLQTIFKSNTLRLFLDHVYNTTTS